MSKTSPKLERISTALKEGEKRLFTILTVDDEALICDMIGDFLREKGYTVKTALSGEEALELITNERPDLVLLDMMMPGMGGEATLREIKRLYWDIPVIMVTVITDEKRAIKLLELGAADYITKPIDFKYLEKNVSLWESMKS